MADPNNIILFQVTDPRGRDVICTHDCWNNHIINGHPELKGWEDKVMDAIRNPHYGIYRDAQYHNRCVYYSKPKGKNYYLKVIVTEVESGADKIVTAFTVGGGKQGEVLIWPQSNN